LQDFAASPARHREQLIFAGQTSLDGLLDSQADLFFRRATGGCVGNCSCWGGDAQTFSVSYFTWL
jgi:hypothetical protein